LEFIIGGERSMTTRQFHPAELTTLRIKGLLFHRMELAGCL
jgi:hypothetical protein